MDKAALKGQSGQIRTEGEWSIGKANSVLQTYRNLKKAWLTLVLCSHNGLVSQDGFCLLFVKNNLAHASLGRKESLRAVLY
jgi:hypothetical protein